MIYFAFILAYITYAMLLWTPTVKALKLNEEIQFMSFMPTGFKVGINERPFKFIKNGDLAKTIRGGCMIGNTTAIA